MILIIGSHEDTASKNIFRHLISSADFKEIKINLYASDLFYIKMIDRQLIYAENIDSIIRSSENIDFNEIIFISRHRSESERVCMTVHPVGNIGKAEYGGKDRTLVMSSPQTMFKILSHLYENYPELSSYEITHHGPYVETKTTFVEIGSNEEAWKNESYGEIVANSILSLANNKVCENDAYVGIGGGHYAPRFTELSIRHGMIFGHIISKYHVEELNEEILREAIRKTPGCRGICIHKKSLSSENRKRVIELVNSVQVPIIEK